MNVKRPKSAAGISGTLLGCFSYVVFNVSKSILFERCRQELDVLTKAKFPLKPAVIPAE